MREQKPSWEEDRESADASEVAAAAWRRPACSEGASVWAHSSASASVGACRSASIIDTRRLRGVTAPPKLAVVAAVEQDKEEQRPAWLSWSACDVRLQMLSSGVRPGAVGGAEGGGPGSSAVTSAADARLRMDGMLRSWAMAKPAAPPPLGPPPSSSATANDVRRFTDEMLRSLARLDAVGGGPAGAAAAPPASSSSPASTNASAAACGSRLLIDMLHHRCDMLDMVVGADTGPCSDSSSRPQPASAAPDSPALGSPWSFPARSRRSTDSRRKGDMNFLSFWPAVILPAGLNAVPSHVLQRGGGRVGGGVSRWLGGWVGG